MNTEIKQILIIDDDEDYRNLIARKLSRSFQDLKIEEIDPLENDMPDENYYWDDIDLIVLDYNLGLEYTGLDWFKNFKLEEMPATVLLTAKGSEELAVQAIKIGIDDYIVKEHFDDKKLAKSITECVYNKKQEKIKLSALKNQSIVFNKYNFISRLKLITNEKDTNNHLLLINPVAYREIGNEKGLSHQDRYINFIADCIYSYISSENLNSNIFIYREEYIAIIIETGSYEKHLAAIIEKLVKAKYSIELKKYPCLVNVGVISPKHLEESEFNKSDFELLSIALELCKTAKMDQEKNIYNYGEIKIKDTEVDKKQDAQIIQLFDIEKAVKDGRISANYQPWVYILSDDKNKIKDIYDVRVELLDIYGIKIPQKKLLKVLGDTFAKRMIDKWVLNRAANQIIEFNKQKDKTNNIKLALKITLSSIGDPTFLDWLENMFEDVNIPNSCLFFEIEASQFIRDSEQCKSLMKTIGVKYDIKFILSGLDKVDTYYTVRESKIFDFVKLDIKKLIFGIPRNPLSDLVKKIKDDGASIIAINVADAETLAFATDFRIDYVHGYLIGKPYIDVISDSDGDLYCVI
jgi:EAL domain-containing protein (putative c-di-GMP-specific phosphodiesterase class I)/ActR/RegA family two-component response regulator